MSFKNKIVDMLSKIYIYIYIYQGNFMNNVSLMCSQKKKKSLMHTNSDFELMNKI